MPMTVVRGRRAPRAWRCATTTTGAQMTVEIALVDAGRAGRRAARARRDARSRTGAGRGMKFVDEFRDAELGRARGRGDPVAGRARPPLQGDGGVRRPHPLDLQVRRRRPAAGERRARARPGLPGVRDPDGTRRRRDRDRPRAGRDLHLLRRHDARARAPSGSLLDAKAAGADIRMVYSPLDALRIAKQNPDREVVFFAIGFETTAPSTALTLQARAGRGRRRTSRCMCSHVTIVPPLRALLESPDLRLDGFIGPGHVSTVVGARPFEFIPADYGKPVVIAGFEPLDILQAIAMILRQLAEGRCEVENQYKRVVPYEGNLRALEVMAEVFELRPHFEWRGLGFISHSGLKLVRGVRRPRRRAALQRPRRARRRPEGVPVRRGAQGRDQAVGVQGVRHRLHAGAADRHLHGLVRGRVRRVLQLRPLRARAGGRVMARPDAVDLRARAEDPRDHRDGARQAREVPRRADQHGARRRRQGDPEPDRGAARAGVRLRRR